VAVTLGFLGQPSSDEATLGAFLRRVLADPAIDSLTLVVAWARFRGLIRLRDEVEAFRARGGKTRLIVGIDEGGATRPGLLLAGRLFDEASIFHDPAGGTFHPKIYLAAGGDRALLVVGSSNATPGGWFNNYEASLEARFDLPQDANHPALTGVYDYLNSLLSEHELLLPLTEELVDKLVRDRRFNVSGHERSTRSRRSGSGGETDEADTDASGSGDDAGDEQRLFGRRRGPRTYAPPLSSEAQAELASLEIRPDDEAELDPPLPAPTDAPGTPGALSAPASEPAANAVPVETWNKVLPRGDAQQQRSSGTNITGNVRLTKAGHDIEWTTWFRQTLFGPAAWRTDHDVNGNPIERADIPFQVTIDGVSFGTVGLEVTHAPHRESGQANHTTVLRWGQLLETMRATDYTDHTLTLERMSDGSYRLDVSG